MGNILFKGTCMVLLLLFIFFICLGFCPEERGSGFWYTQKTPVKCRKKDNASLFFRSGNRGSEIKITVCGLKAVW